MTKQALIENILDLWLSQRQLEYMKDQWHYFYNNPLEFKDTIVVRMIRLDLVGVA